MDNLYCHDGDMFSIGVDDPGITVDSPSFTTILGGGEEKVIRWTSSGIAGSPVKIQLVNDDGTLVEEITPSTENDGEYEWTVAEIIAPGSYMIRINTVDGSYGDDGDLFEISEQPGFIWWAIGDTHVHTLICDETSHDDELSLQNVLKDAELGGGEGGESFVWDLATLTGDYVGKGDVPRQWNGDQWLAQYDPTVTSYRPYMFYGVIGNHDAGAGDNLWFRQYIDPLGEYPAISGVTNADRPHQVSADSAWDHYSFQVGNVLFLMLGDHNQGYEPFGRVEQETNSSCQGHGAARFTRATFEWWKSKVEANQDKIIVTVTHNAPANTTVHTGLREPYLFNEIYDFNVHAGWNWADGNGGGMIYGIDDSEAEDAVTIGIDGSIDNGNDTFINIGERDWGFLKYLEQNTGAIDLWLHGHTHSILCPAIYCNGKTDAEKKFGVWFINAGAVNRGHSAAQVTFSRVLQFYNGDNRVIMKTYLHSGELRYSNAQGKRRYWLENNNGWMPERAEGFFDPAQRILTLDKVFNSE
jgi:hypothetical protein